MNISNYIFLLLVNSAIYVATDDIDLCVGLPKEEIIPLPHETNCSLYYECFNGELTLNECPDGLYYNPISQMCDFPEQSGCTNVDLQCVGKDLDYLPYPEDCSKYIECYLGHSYLMVCPPNFWFDSRKKMCTLPEESDCGQVTLPPSTPTPIPTTPTPTTPPPTTPTPSPTTPTPTTPTPTTPTTPTPTTPTPTTPTPTPTIPPTTPSWTTPHPICWGVRPNEVILVPYPGDCSKYYRCDGANLSVESCPGGLLFDESTQSCDFPDAVNCDQTTATPGYPTTTDPNVTPVTPPDWQDPRCEDGEISYWPHPVICEKYIECYHGHGYEMDCPNGLVFENSLKKCVTPNLSECGTTTRAPTSTYIPPHEDCEYNGQLLPYPGDCTKFYECTLGKKVEMDCPNNLWFNTEINECDYPYNTHCEWARAHLKKILSYP